MPHPRLRRLCSALILIYGLGGSGAVNADKLHTLDYGIGPSLLFVHSNCPAIGSREIVGLSLDSSIRVGDNLYVNSGTTFSHIRTGTTSNVVYPPDGADYLVLWGTVRKTLRPVEHAKWTPWVALGINLSDIAWNTFNYNITGFGYTVQIGADWNLGPGWRLRTQIGQHSYSANDNYGFGPYQTDLREVSAVLLYRLPIH